MPHQRWEYRVAPAGAPHEEIAALGDVGWELCAAAPPLLYFKRPAPTLQERVTADQRARALRSGGTLHTGLAAAAPRLLHPALRDALAAAGHTDLVLVADRGFPVPPGPRRIDLALCDGVPTVTQVLAAAAADVRFDRLVVAEEVATVAPERLHELSALLPGTPVERLPHAEFKAVAASARVAVRTGDTVPYANVLFAIG